VPIARVWLTSTRFTVAGYRHQATVGEANAMRLATEILQNELCSTQWRPLRTRSREHGRQADPVSRSSPDRLGGVHDWPRAAGLYQRSLEMIASVTDLHAENATQLTRFDS
jgi:hypothetical protein